MNTKTFFSSLALLLFLATSCTNQVKKQTEENPNDILLLSTLYQQQTGEYRALCHQAYHSGLAMLNSVDADTFAKPPAIVLDLDETVLDNSPYQARCILDNYSYPVGWKEWCNEANAAAVPGAEGFLKEAAKEGFEIFYITNRKDNIRAKTLENLKALKLPFADSAHLFTRSTTSAKQGRRDIVSKKYTIFMLFGDNLNDFAEVFDGKMASERKHLSDSLQEAFGKRYFILPNPMYGDWANAIMNYAPNLSPAERDSLAKMALLPKRP